MDHLHGIRVVNANYNKVVYYIDKMLSETGRYCNCARCRMDAVALALNTLPPHYHVDTGEDMDTELGSPWVLIEMAARESLEAVRNSSRAHIRCTSDELHSDASTDVSDGLQTADLYADDERTGTDD